jgi:U3 small nucleolar RNA-associated protein 18
VYTRRLRQQFERIYPLPEWASSVPRKRRDSDSDTEGDQLHASDPLSALFQSSAPLTQRPTTYLPDDILAIAAVAPIPIAPGNPLPQSLHFHPSHPLLLIAYKDNTIRVHSVDGNVNPLATSLKISRLKVRSAIFHPTKNLVYITGLRHRSLLIWNLMSGQVKKMDKTLGDETTLAGEWRNLRFSPDGSVMGLQGLQGWISFLSAESGVYLGGCKIDGNVADYTFTHDGKKAIVASVGGEIWEFDVEAMKMTNRWRDEGGVSLTRIALTPDDKFLAIGSLSGIVTIYNLSKEEHVPQRTLYNLTTPITSLSFSPDGQMLVMASSGKRDQLRAVHIPSLKVFPNWPTSKTPIGLVECIALGENGYLAVGRKKGVALWKVREM